MLAGTSGKASMTLDSAGVAGPSPVQALGFAVAGCMTMDVGLHPDERASAVSRAAIAPGRRPRRGRSAPHRPDAPAGDRRGRGAGRRGGARARALATRSTARCGTRCGRTSCSPPRMTSTHRRAYVDWARGIAVLLMIEAHTLDAWTRLEPERAAHDRVSRRDGARRLRGAAVSLARRPRRRAGGDARRGAHRQPRAPRSR